MATRIAWLLNLDADLELAEPARYRPSPAMEARIVELRAKISDLIEANDVILGAPLPRGERGSYVPQAFSLTRSALARLAALGFLELDAPDFEVIQRVNDRAFCAELGQTLAPAHFVRDLASLREILGAGSPTGLHVLKPSFSFAGRGMLRVQQGKLDAATERACERTFERGHGLQVEPWFERLADFSLHGFLMRSGTFVLGAPREQQCDARGQFVAMGPEAPSLAQHERSLLVGAAEQTALALRAAGYFGPFGIDAFRYRDPEAGPRFNPRCEINARFTMGYPRALLERALAQREAAGV